MGGSPSKGRAHRGRGVGAPQNGAGGGQGSAPSPAVLRDPPTAHLGAQNMTAGSIIYTVSATDADTGNSAKVSYSILEVSTAPGHRRPDTVLLGGSA